MNIMMIITLLCSVIAVIVALRVKASVEALRAEIADALRARDAGRPEVEREGLLESLRRAQEEHMPLERAVKVAGFAYADSFDEDEVVVAALAAGYKPIDVVFHLASRQEEPSRIFGMIDDTSQLTIEQWARALRPLIAGETLADIAGQLTDTLADNLRNAGAGSLMRVPEMIGCTRDEALEALYRHTEFGLLHALDALGDTRDDAGIIKLASAIGCDLADEFEYRYLRKSRDFSEAVSRMLSLGVPLESAISAAYEFDDFDPDEQGLAKVFDGLQGRGLSDEQIYRGIADSTVGEGKPSISLVTVAMRRGIPAGSIARSLEESFVNQEYFEKKMCSEEVPLGERIRIMQAWHDLSADVGQEP